MAHKRRYELLFFAHHGPGPWACGLCGSAITMEEVLGRLYATAIHHLDGKHENNDPKNLAIVHYGCHTSHHSLGVVRSSQWKARQRAAQLGVKRGPLSSEHRAKIGNALRGVPKTAEHVRNSQAGLKKARKESILAGSGRREKQ